MLLLFACLFYLGKKYASERAGLIAVCVAGTMPMLYAMSRMYLVECGLTALVCLFVSILDG
jgi:4-amino-4-deoxy-L-arabinose transferase-like glycosyltransferase